jgi:CheY-like chemotaxis protein
VVDDDPGVVQLIATFARKVGFEVATAASGEEALQAPRGQAAARRCSSSSIASGDLRRTSAPRSLRARPAQDEVGDRRRGARGQSDCSAVCQKYGFDARA